MKPSVRSELRRGHTPRAVSRSSPFPTGDKLDLALPANTPLSSAARETRTWGSSTMLSWSPVATVYFDTTPDER